MLASRYRALAQDRWQTFRADTAADFTKYMSMNACMYFYTRPRVLRAWKFWQAEQGSRGQLFHQKNNSARSMLPIVLKSRQDELQLLDDIVGSCWGAGMNTRVRCLAPHARAPVPGPVCTYVAIIIVPARCASRFKTGQPALKRAGPF